jgi:tetratricopeptide (TPR) repeat protein
MACWLISATPKVQEDSPVRAVAAALKLRGAGERLKTPLGEPIGIRVGVATGLVVVGDLIGQGPAQERAVAGEAPNLAARLQSVAQPNAVVVSDATQRLARGVFEFQRLPDQTLRGFPAPVAAWVLEGERPSVDRFDARRSQGVTPLIARREELAAIEGVFDRAAPGAPWIIGLLGDSGIGKSRLLEEVRRTLRRSGDIWIEASAVGLHQHSPLYLASQLSRAAAELESRLSGESIGELTRDAQVKDLRDRLDAVPAGTRVVVVVEDLQWADASSLEVIEDLLALRFRVPVIFLFSSRMQPPERWSKLLNFSVVHLGPLGPEDSAALTRQSDATLSHEDIASIVGQAGGVPLYIEELTRAYAARPSSGTVPESLADLLAASLDRLGKHKRSAQIAAVLGQTFPERLFVAMLEQEGVSGQAELEALTGRSVILPAQTDGSAPRKFRHALIAAAAHAALVRREKRALHARAAKLLSDGSIAQDESFTQTIAHHWEEAGEAAKAIEYWESAGVTARGRGAFAEAEHHFRRAVACLTTISDHSVADELRLRSALRRVLNLTQGFTSEEAERESTLIQQLAEQEGARALTLRERQASWVMVTTSGDYARARNLAEEINEQDISDVGSPRQSAFHQRALIQLNFYTGQLNEAHRAYESWRRVWPNVRSPEPRDVLSIGLTALAFAAQGLSGEAEVRMDLTRSVAASLNDPFNWAMALHIEAALSGLFRDGTRLERVAEKMAEHAQNAKLDYATLLAMGWQGVSDIERQRGEPALEKLDRAINGMRSLRALISMPFWLACRARAEALSGRYATAVDSFAEASSFNPDERIFRPDVFMRRAEFYAQRGNVDEAALSLRRAIRIARAMGANAYLARAAALLTNIHLETGNSVAARQAAQVARRNAPADPCPYDRDLMQSVPHF